MSAVPAEGPAAVEGSVAESVTTTVGSSDWPAEVVALPLIFGLSEPSPTLIGYPAIIEATRTSRESGRLFSFMHGSMQLHTKVCHPLASKFRVARTMGTPAVSHRGANPRIAEISASHGRAASPLASFSKCIKLKLLSATPCFTGYAEILEDLKKDPESHGGPPDCILLCRLREQVLREVGFRDIFKKVKDEENAKAISLFEEVVRLNDAIKDEAKRVKNLVRGIFAGNIFDLGSAKLAELFSEDGMSFLASCQNLVPRPWVIDDMDTFITKWSKKTWKKAVIFVDNSGADIILGILPFARELLRHGAQVVLAANDLPSINDVTYTELVEIISKLKDEHGKLIGVDTSNLLVANSGNDLPVSGSHFLASFTCCRASSLPPKGWE
ncbi:damage-control phosphatase At2g17340-like [Nicotiana tomentosiformis]|uniref:damage-control phosphatase At2g17340-like n=1 Tax=Nicotiana tomentosiformis TaxID=4098 RepID=UPI00388C5021